MTFGSEGKTIGRGFGPKIQLQVRQTLRVRPVHHPLIDNADVPRISDDRQPDWAVWHPSAPYTLGVEEEAMILHPADWSLAWDTQELLSRLPLDLARHVAAETHEAAIELATTPLLDVADVSSELQTLRAALAQELEGAGLQAACAGTHPRATWTETRVSEAARYQLVYESMRELARREPTFALHVHVGVPDPSAAIQLLNRLRAHLPLLLALSVNSPFWQGRDTGLASSRTPIFQAFPRVGIPRAFSSYPEYVSVVQELVRCGAFPDPSFLWWDARPRPVFGTVEVRVMDAQTSADRSAALAGLIQSVAHLELEEGFHDAALVWTPEILAENRFLAARDGMSAQLLDPASQSRVPAADLLGRLLCVARPHAQELDAEAALDLVAEMARTTGAERQRRHAAARGLTGVLRMLTTSFTG